ncbi:hypothetical protein [Variovorax sp. GrIS 2.14]|uniref:hypothetical protein n=1 Tax=Variovorax sp. GrIS 2.14 TaxID=3071709 RepID=UPI0038F745FC
MGVPSAIEGAAGGVGAIWTGWAWALKFMAEHCALIVLAFELPAFSAVSPLLLAPQPRHLPRQMLQGGIKFDVEQFTFVVASASVQLNVWAPVLYRAAAAQSQMEALAKPQGAPDNSRAPDAIFELMAKLTVLE